MVVRVDDTPLIDRKGGRSKEIIKEDIVEFKPYPS